jgi:hypothetical protein
MEEVAMKLILSEQRYGLTSSNDNWTVAGRWHTLHGCKLTGVGDKQPAAWMPR